MAEGPIVIIPMEDVSGKKPHFRGFLRINGEDHELSAWPALNGGKGFSGSFKPKGSRKAKPAA
jgi:hypothetical protein